MISSGCNNNFITFTNNDVLANYTENQ